jgi:hypothetical protein
MLATIQSRTLASHLLYKNVKIRAYRTVTFPVVLYGCETLPGIRGGTQTVFEQGACQV